MNLWFLLFVLSIGSGGFFALLVALARTPGVSSLLPVDLFYHWLIGHVDLALIIGFLSFLLFLWHGVFGVEEKRYELAFAYSGTLLVLLSALLGLGTPVHNNYVPTVNHPLFFAGIFLFGLGYTLCSVRLLKRSFGELFSRDPLRSVLSVSILLSILLSLTLIVSFFKTPELEEIYLYFERLYWLPGHIHQFVNASLLISSWILLVRLSGNDVPGRFSLLNLTLIPFPVLYFLLQVFHEDSLSREVKELTTAGYAFGIGVPTITFASFLLLKFAFRRNFYLNILGLSAGIYLLGALMGYLIAGSDLRIPAHYHGVIASILISLMVLTYHYLTEFGRIRRLPKLVKLQPYIYGTGMLLFVLGLFWSGYFGAPRKTPGTGYIESMDVYLFMLLMGLGSVLSVVGGIIFVTFVLYSIIKRGEHGREEETQP